MQILTLVEAAKFLKVSRSWLYHRKDVPRHPLPGGRGIRFFQEELETWLRGGEQGESSVPGTPEPEYNPLAGSQSSGYYRIPRHTTR